MLTHLQIKNFKGWRDTGPIRLAPLTVFFGTNSSGKSSLGQFLLMLKQTAQSADRLRVIHAGDPGDINSPIDLGSYRDLVTGHAEEEHVSFKVGWELAAKLSLKDVKSDQTFSGDKIVFESEMGLPGGGLKNVIVHHFSYVLGDPSRNGFQVGMKLKDNNKPQYDLTSAKYDFVRTPGRAWPLPPPYHFYGFPDETVAYYQNADVVRDLSLQMEKRLEQIYYLGPLREHPRRSYSWSGEKPEHVGFRGQNAVSAILAARERKISPQKDCHAKPFESVIAKWLKQLGLIADFSIKEIKPPFYEVLLKTFGKQAPVSLTDVGFGISQVLPVLVQCYYAPPGSTIIIEQPEIHLHPSAQSCLADLFIEVINSRENGQDRRIQLVIESHSEHFLIRLQRRIAEHLPDKPVNNTQVAAYFTKIEDMNSVISELQIDPYGNISNWPENFFGDEMGDLVAMSRAAAMRRAEEKAARQKNGVTQ